MFFRQFTIKVRDVEKSIHFYETIAGLSVTRRYQNGQADIVFLANEAGETQIELVAAPELKKFQGGGFFISFETSDLDGARNNVVKQGLEPTEIRQPDAEYRYFYVYDPDGVSVQIIQK